MKLALIVAMENERQAVMQLLGGREHGKVGRNEVSLYKSGIGKVNAALGADDIIRREHPDAILSTGVAGGIDESLQVMDVVAGSETCYHDVWCGEGNEPGQVQGLPARYAADAQLLKAAEKMTLHRGLICTGDQFVTSRKELDRIKAAFPKGLAVDMESAAIAQTCYLRKMPFMTLRIISDTPGNTDDHLQQYANFWKEMSDKSFRTLQCFLEVL